MATYYVAASGGSNSNAGTAGLPWATLQYGVDNAGSGNIVYLQAGTHIISTQVTVPVGVSITGAGVTSIISSSVATTEWTSTIYLLSATEGTNGNQSISYIKMDGDNLTAHVAVDVSRRSNVKIHHCTFENFEFYGCIFQGCLTGSMPTTWATGNEFYNNTVTNCSGYIGGFGRGSIGVGGQEGMLIYDNVLTQSTRAVGSNGYCIKYVNEGYNKGNQIYNNTFTREPYQTASVWNFGIEICQWEQGGLHIYNNTFNNCALDLGARRKTTYDYAVSIHNNTFQKTQRGGADGENDPAIIFEQDVDVAIVRYNLIKDFPNGIVMQSANATVNDVYIQYNIFQQIGTTTGGSVGRGIMVTQGSTSSYANRWYIENNTIDAYTGGATGRIGINLPSKAIATEIYIRNNIIQGFDFTFLSGYENGSLNGLYIQYNILYQNGHSNDPYYENGYLPTNIISTNNIKDNPDFTTPGSDFTLQAGSPAINAGLSVGLTTDYLGNTVPYGASPDIGAYEYFGIVYYVAASGGSNSNAGTAGSPWATIAYAVTQVTSGNTIYMQAGTHTINTTVALPIGISIRGAGETSIITTTNATDWHTTINLQSAEGTSGDQSISYLYFDGNLTGDWAIVIQGRSNVEIHHCTFIDWDIVGVTFSGRSDGQELPPSTYATGNKFYNNTVTDCNKYTSYGSGSLNIGGQEGMLIYNNTMTSGGRATGTNGWPIKYSDLGYLKGCKIYDNIITSTDITHWNFAIEFFNVYGIEIYGNTITGAIDLNLVSKDMYDYGAYIHNNILGPVAAAGKYYQGIILEITVSDVIIKYNRFRNVGEGIYYTIREVNPNLTNQDISYNIFENIGQDCGGITWGAIRMWSDAPFLNNILGTFNIYNNVFYAYPSSVWFGVGIGGFSSATEINIVNNVFVNFLSYWFQTSTGDNLTTLNIKNNIFYNNGNSNNPAITGTPTNYVNSGNQIDNPDFVTPGSDFTLQVGSPAINAGLDVGLTTDYLGYTVPFGIAPDIGAYEYGSSNTSDELTLIEGTWLTNRTILNEMFQNLYSRIG